MPLSIIPALAAHYPALHVFHYLTVRTGCALLTALAVGLVLGPSFILFLKKRQHAGQPIRTCGPQSHLAKAGTPTMGGFLILSASVGSTLFWAELGNPFIQLALATFISFGALGAYDDWQKLSQGNAAGLSARYKFGIQVALSLAITAVVIHFTPSELHTGVTIPCCKNCVVYLGWAYLLWGVCVIAGTSNAVNLTDGLDGLAIVPSMQVASCFIIISYLVGHAHFADYLYIHHIPQAGELTVFLGALIGGGLAFLWFNAPPAKVFMGDTGSLSIGATLGAVALMTHHELVLAIVGGLFVIEAVSVIIQVLVFRLDHGKRVFLMAPFHHHLEKAGWPEPTITIRFWIVSTVLALIGLSTLKFR